MEKALERTIETLIDSGGDKWEYDSKDIQTLVQWIENKQKEVNVALGNVSNCYQCNSKDTEVVLMCTDCGATAEINE
jgi:hypothetical protein